MNERKITKASHKATEANAAETYFQQLLSEPAHQEFERDVFNCQYDWEYYSNWMTPYTERYRRAVEAYKERYCNDPTTIMRTSFNAAVLLRRLIEKIRQPQSDYFIEYRRWLERKLAEVDGGNGDTKKDTAPANELSELAKLVETNLNQKQLDYLKQINKGGKPGYYAALVVALGITTGIDVPRLCAAINADYKANVQERSMRKALSSYGNSPDSNKTAKIRAHKRALGLNL